MATLPQSTSSRRHLAHGGRLWNLVALDVMAISWMITAGEWFDGHGGPIRVVTLGGHHQLVLVLAAISLAVLSVLAVTTEGFTWFSGPEMAVLSVAGLTTLVAVAGFLSIVLLVVGIGGLIGLLFRLGRF